MEKIVRFENVSKRYRLGLTRTSIPSVISTWVQRAGRKSSLSSREEQFIWALKDVTFEMKSGESLALVGPNGAGKTTILKVLANITRPTSGKSVVRGKLSALIELGAGFHPDLTGRENVYLNGAILDLPRKEIDKRYAEIVEFSELTNFMDTPIKRYSSGMAVRLGFSVAACIDPEVLLVDEVLAVGDAAFRQKCLKRIENLLRRGTSVIFVSHNLYMVKAICKSALYIDHGEVQTRGTTDEVIEAYERDLHRHRIENIEVRKEDKNSRSENFIISRVKVTSSGESETGVLSSTAPAEINVYFESTRKIPKIQLAVYIIRSDGITCCMIRSSLNKFDISLEKGISRVIITIDPLQLISGAYYVEAYALNEQDSMILFSASSDWFEVSGVGLSYEEQSGVFEPITRWRM